MANDKFVLTTITLETKGKKIELSLDDAKALHAQLDALFGSRTVYLPSAPIVIERDHYPWPTRYPHWTPVTWGMTSGGGGFGGGSLAMQSENSGLCVSYSGEAR